MKLEDMEDLVIINDGITEVEEAASLLCNAPTAVSYNEGALGKLSKVYDLIRRNSKFYDDSKDLEEITDEEGRTMIDILNMDIPAMERAKMLMP